MTDESIRRRTRADILAATTSIILEVARQPPGTDIAADAPLGRGVMTNKEPPQGLGLNCIDHVEILCAAEDAFGVTITPEDSYRINTLGELVDHICRIAGITEEQAA